MARKPLPPELIESFPHLAGDLLEEHPSNGEPIGPPPRGYTVGLHQAIVANVRDGNLPITAAGMAGISSSTFHRWMQLGKEGNPHLVELVDDIERAMAGAEGEALKTINPLGDAENAKWYLERTRGARFNKEANAKFEAALTDFMSKLRDGLPHDVYMMVLAVASGNSLPELEGPARFQLAPAVPNGDTE